MKKFVVIITLIIFLVGCACSVKGGAKESVYIFLEKYKYLDKDLVEDIDNYVKEEILTDEQKEEYKNIFIRQYKDMNFTITKEEYKDNKAYVTVNITIYDLYKAQDEAEEYLAEHQNDFLTENGEYDDNKFINYKLDYMKTYNEKITNEVTFTLHEEKGFWIVEQPTTNDLEKIHGIYH